MQYRYAKKLHNEDEVVLKDCQKPARVLSTRVDEVNRVSSSN
jgi:hypothetical protein